MTTRQAQVASNLQHAIQRVIARDVHDPRVRGLVSVTKVDVSPDLRDAIVHVSVLPATHESRTIHGLKSAAGRIRTQVGKAVRIRNLPRIDFRLDRTLKKQAAIEASIRAGMPLDPSEELAIEGRDAPGDESS